MDWILRVEADPAERAALQVWLAANPGHEAAWQEALRAWNMAAAVPAQHKADWETPTAKISHGTIVTGAKIPPFSKTPALRYIASWRTVATGIAALLALFLMVGLWPIVEWRLHADMVAASGESREMRLMDGSVVQLDSGSAIKVHYSATSREISLLRGQAFFQVQHDPARPFAVHAGNLDVRVVGTAFNINAGESSYTVAVQSGLVELRHGSLNELLRAGDRLVIDRNGGGSSLSQIAPADIAVWRDGLLFVENALLSEVVQELRRYSSNLILITDAELARRRVTGLYDIRDPDRALQALVEPYGAGLRRYPLLRVLHK